jgi:hypothetical protein
MSRVLPAFLLACVGALTPSCGSSSDDENPVEIPEGGRRTSERDPSQGSSRDAGSAAAPPTRNTPDSGVTGPTRTTPDASAPPGSDTGPHDHTPPRDAGGDAKLTMLAPGCDEDNPISNEALGLDRTLPPEIVQFERRNNWGCMHREWHDMRQWDFDGGDDPAGSDLARYAKKKGWKRNPVQEGAPGNGLEFLAMHRAMLGMLRSTFSSQTALFAGWTTPPLVTTADDPLPPDEIGSPFDSDMKTAVARLLQVPVAFPTDDALGLYIETTTRWTPNDPAASTPDQTAGIHSYLHGRYNDQRSAIQMNRFSRNIENRAFWRLHGYLDNMWTKNRAARGVNDANDAVYMTAMNKECVHMGRVSWSVQLSTCVGP